MGGRGNRRPGTHLRQGEERPMSRDAGNLIQIANDLQLKAEAQRDAHYRASDHLRVGHYVIGIFLICLSAVVSGSVLRASEENSGDPISLAAGVLAILVVILTSIQTTFKLGERGEQHRTAASGFGKVARKLEVLANRPHSETEKAWDDLCTIESEFDGVEASAPGFLTWTYNRAKEKAKKEAKEAKKAVRLE
jgi:hypothetical protein